MDMHWNLSESFCTPYREYEKSGTICRINFDSFFLIIKIEIEFYTDVMEWYESIYPGTFNYMKYCAVSAISLGIVEALRHPYVWRNIIERNAFRFLWLKFYSDLILGKTLQISSKIHFYAFHHKRQVRIYKRMLLFFVLTYKNCGLWPNIHRRDI